MTVDIHKGIEFLRRAVKFNGMTIAWVVSDFCDKEIILDAMKHPEGFRFPCCSWRNDEETASGAIHLYPEKVICTDYNWYNFRNRMVQNN